jgi:hypothetical protein
MNPLDDAFDMHKKDASILISSEVMITYLVSHGAKPTTLAFYDFLKHCTDAKYYTLIRLYILAGININGGDYDQRFHQFLLLLLFSSFPPFCI